MTTLTVVAILLTVVAALALFCARELPLGSLVLVGGAIVLLCFTVARLFTDPVLVEFYHLAALSTFGLTTAICGATLLWKAWKKKLGLAFGTLALLTMVGGDALAMYATAKQLPHVGYVLEKLQAGDIR